MQQLTALDGWFLSENDTVFQHFCDILVFEEEGRGLSLTTLRDLLQDRIHLVPPMRQRLLEAPFGMDEPYWIDDPAFDVDNHLHEHTLDGPGDARRLAELAAEIASSRLDRTRPLWELHLVHGLEDGRLALIKKLHHAAFDGGSSLELTSVLLDPTPETRIVEPPVEDWAPEAAPLFGELCMRTFMDMTMQPYKMFRAQQRMMRASSSRTTTTSAEQAVPTEPTEQQAHNPLQRMFTAVPPVAWNGRVSADRSVAFGTVGNEVVRRIKDAAGVRFNDVVVAICAGALRDWLRSRGELPGEALRVCVPISVRTEEEQGLFGNRVSILLGDLPTHIGDPLDRLRATRDAMDAAKAAHAAAGPDMLTDLGTLTMAAGRARASRAAAAMMLPTVEPPLQWNVSVSSLLGPAEPLYLAGHRLAAHYPVGMLGANQGLFISAASYVDSLSFGLVADPSLVPDLWEITARFQVAAEELDRTIGGGAPRQPVTTGVSKSEPPTERKPRTKRAPKAPGTTATRTRSNANSVDLAAGGATKAATATGRKAKGPTAKAPVTKKAPTAKAPTARTETSKSTEPDGDKDTAKATSSVSDLPAATSSTPRGKATSDTKQQTTGDSPLM